MIYIDTKKRKIIIEIDADNEMDIVAMHNGKEIATFEFRVEDDDIQDLPELAYGGSERLSKSRHRYGHDGFF